MKTKLAKLSVCPCGFPLLDESIPLGTEYEIEPTRRIKVTLYCGGCHAGHNLEAVFVNARGNSHGGYLPAEVFEPNK